MFTGLSGSGKLLGSTRSTPEGQRRYVESLSSYARQFLGQMDKPDVDFIEGLSPAISIDQKSFVRENPRSTVGTVTEIYDYLRLLYADRQPHCPSCGRLVTRQSPQQIVDRRATCPTAPGSRFSLRWCGAARASTRRSSTTLPNRASRRARVDGQLIELSDRATLKLARYEQHTIEVVVDRLVRRDGIERRLTDSIETALRLGEGIAAILLMPDAKSSPPGRRTKEAAKSCGCQGCRHRRGRDRGRPEEGLRKATATATATANRCSHSPSIWHACIAGSRWTSWRRGASRSTRRSGRAHRATDWAPVSRSIPIWSASNPDLSLSQGAIGPWAGARTEYFSRVLKAVADTSGFGMDKPWSKLSKPQRKILLYGAGTRRVHVQYRNRYGTLRSYDTQFEGVVPWLQRRHSDADSEWVREQVEGYMREVACPDCGGTRCAPRSRSRSRSGAGASRSCRRCRSGPRTTCSSAWS